MVVPSVIVVGLGVVLSVGLAGLTVTCSAVPLLSLAVLLLPCRRCSWRPTVGARHRARGRQRVAGGRGVGAVAADRGRLGVHQGAAQVAA